MRRDQLFALSYKDVQMAMMGCLDRLQHFPPNVMLAAVGWMFLRLCDHFKIDPRDALDAADRTYRRALDVDPQYPRALAEYIREEIPRG